MTAQADRSLTEDLAVLAAEAFLYGFPLVFDLQEVERFTRTGMGALAPAPLNEFSHATALAGPRGTFVSINNDTVYSIAHLDMSSGPVRLRGPGYRRAATTCCSSSTPGRTTSPMSGIARRGPLRATFLLVPPGWDGACRLTASA